MKTPPPLISLFSTSSSPHSSGPTVVQVQQTALQSARPVLSELVHAALKKGQKVVLLTSGEQLPSAIVPKTSDVVVISTSSSRGYGQEQQATSSRPQLWKRVTTELEAIPRSQSIAFFVDSLDGLLDEATDGTDPIREVFSVLRKAVSCLASHSGSTFVFVSSSAACSLQPKLEAQLIPALLSPHFVSTRACSSSSMASDITTGGSSSIAGSAFLTVRLTPPAIWRHLLKEYGTGLRPSSTPVEVVQQLRDGAVRQARQPPIRNSGASTSFQRRDASTLSNQRAAQVNGSADLADIFGLDAKRTTDPRLWPVLAGLNSSSDVAEGSWFYDSRDNLQGEELEAVRPPKGKEAASSLTWDPINERITLSDLLGPSSSSSRSGSSSSDKRFAQGEAIGSHRRPRTGWGVITCQCRLPGGKFGEEVYGCISRLETSSTSTGSSGTWSRLRLVPLEMADRRAATETAPQPAAASNGLLDSLPFNLSLTEEQRARRQNIDLPFAPSERIYEGLSRENPELVGQEAEGMGVRRGTTGRSEIYFEPDSADEEDEEDPDEDLDF